MPGGGRRLPRTVRNTVAPTLQLIPGEPPNNRFMTLGTNIPTLPGLEHPVAPKHFPFPTTPVANDVFFEIIIYVFTLVAGALQFVHLYRSVWWLPHSNTKDTIHFYLIDANLVCFIAFVLARRLLYVLGCRIIEYVFPEKTHSIACNCYRLLLFTGIMVVLAWFAYKVMMNNHISYICYLCYPVVVYAILFGFKLLPFFELVNWNSGEKPPFHACSTSPRDIRGEVESLKTNFNNRLKQILFSSVFNAHYAGFVPCCFVQSYVHYDVFWAAQHIVFIYMACLMSYTNHALTLRYCDILHRSALHLGYWERVETRSILPVAYSWQEGYLWPNGALVRHGKETYRAYGESNAAEPGNSTYTRFYFLFKNPSVPLGWVLMLQLTLVLYQLILLAKSIYWYCMLSLLFVLFLNYFTLFKIARDYMISTKIYKAERNLHAKLSMH